MERKGFEFLVKSWLIIVAAAGVVSCSEAEPKPATASCGGDTTPTMCGCPGDEYPSTECVDGEWFCPGPNSCPDPGNNTTPNAPTNATTPNVIPNPTCTVESVSDIPGVSLEITTDRCAFTQAELADGVTFEYAYVIEEEVEIVPSADLSCWRTLPGNFPHEYQIVGNDQRYCLCDVGLCPEDTSPLVLQPGTYRESFEWTGRNWNGPSDTGEPMGDPFPPGTYTLSVRSSGMLDGQSFEVLSTLDIAVLE